MKIAILSFMLSALLSVAYGQAKPGENLCFNGGFDNAEDPFKGWMVNLEWLGNTHYMKNHTRISLEENYKGYKNVAFINGTSETKLESKPIKFEQGARYRCTIDINGNTSPHVYFRGHKWTPGVRPYEEAELEDLRTIYKSQFRNHKIQNGANGWKRMTFEFPLEDASALALKHLKYVRYFTVYCVVLADFPGQVYVDNVKVERIK